MRILSKLILRPVRLVLEIALLVSLAIVLAMFLLQFITIPAITSFPLVEAMKRFADPLIAQVGSWVGLRWPGGAAKYLPLGMAAVIWGLRVVVLDGLRDMIHSIEEGKSDAAPARAPRSKSTISGGVAKSGSKKEMDGLLDEYRRIEKALKTAKKTRVAFLNVDVVGSTKMKEGESRTVIAASFQAYEDLLRGIFARHQAWKQSWTPDGVLIAFLDSNSAVSAAQQTIHDLKPFNRDENRMKMPFRVRCGLHVGELAIYEDTKLESFSDPVIDVTMHLQKYAHHNALLVSADVLAELHSREGFHPGSRAVDGIAAYEWSTEPLPISDATPTPTPRLASPPAAAGSHAPQHYAAPAAAATMSPPQPSPNYYAPQPAPNYYAPPPSPAPAPAPYAAAHTPAADRTLASDAGARRSLDHIGRYQITSELGRGAVGRVYKALDPQIGRTVAIKVIQTRDLPADQIGPQKERFAREARAAGKMSHPGIVNVYDVAEDPDGNPCLVMEFVEGTTLADLLHADEGSAASKLVSYDDRLRIAIQVAEGLDYAHRKGVVHRDIKPANIMITRERSSATGKDELQAKIADFGIAKLVEVQGTIAGGVLGTPSFVSPEQLTGGAIDARSDIFSFGVVLYWMFTGEKPFKGDTFTAVTFQVMHSTPRPAREINFALPEQLEAILQRCLAKNPNDRYASAAELATELGALRKSR